MLPRCRIITLCCLSAWSCAALAATPQQLNVYNWSDYIGDQTVAHFEQATGIKVKYDVYDSNDTLQAKLLTGKAGYDIVVPSANFLGRQIDAGIYRKLDKSRLPNLVNLDKNIMRLAQENDPGGKYSVPWAWVTIGMGVNLDKVKSRLGSEAPLNSWELLFDPARLAALKGCGVSVLDEPSDVLPAVLHYLHRDPASTNPADYQAAFEVLKKIRPYITQFNSSGYINDLANGDICLALGYSGDVNIAKHRALEAHKSYRVEYIIPKSGAPVGFDMMAIPRDAANPEAALAWINFIQDPAINAEITNKVYYPTANLAARKYVKPELANDPSIYPSEAVMKTLFPLKPLPPDVMRLEHRLWTQLKTGI
ncbi:polyamine ABC transporter substrate-binding protein [Vogesella sp. LIG4]|uniref:polyamine ABC transporter substrate-binding protein n=1 Tax=Vogesella sp. LIG4 TaxID=1192162 RepID=UPI0008200D47|nr:polyamine ABC transporter substrate-binding protein [Vogesella sp. LIG4]SCK28314.1 putrescine transport system substrate-binding protein [Vogesella sp. LIG4]